MVESGQSSKRMKRYAVIGHPVSHSLSPRIHRAFAEQCGIEISYDLIDIRPEVLGERLAELHVLGFLGLNVTLPHKTATISLCVRVGKAAQDARAVNVLTRSGSGWLGDNTDGTGLVEDLTRNLAFDIKETRVLIVGAGGAARGLLAPLLEQGPAEVVICNRTPGNAEALAATFAGTVPLRCSTVDALEGNRFDLILNATSAGHRGQIPVLPDNLLAADALAYDLNYGAAAEPFLQWAHKQGVRHRADGLGMLVEQAADAFLIWHEKRPLTEPILAALRS